MLQAGVSDLGAGQHARHFVGAGAVVEQAYLHLGAAVVFALFDEEVLIGEGGDLGQVSNAEHLLAATKGLELLADGLGSAASNADVDFVEDKVRGVGFIFLVFDEVSSTATLRASMTRDISPPDAIS